MRAIKEVLYIIALLCAGGVFGFFLAERALIANQDAIANIVNFDLTPLIEDTLSSPQFAFVVVGLPLSIIAVILVQFALRDPRGRLSMLLALLGFAGVTGITLYFNSLTELPQTSLVTSLNLVRILLAGVSLIAVGFAFRANGAEHYR